MNLEVLMARSELATLAGSPDASQFTEPLLANSSNAPTQLLTHVVKLLYAFQLHSNGQRERATRLLNEVMTANEQAIKSGNDTYFPRLQSATVCAIRGDIAQALVWLERAIDSGWRDARTTRLNPMWASLHGEARFEQLVRRMEADVAAMRARADTAGLGVN
jgi:hypothetical protein